MTITPSILHVIQDLTDESIISYVGKIVEALNKYEHHLLVRGQGPINVPVSISTLQLLGTHVHWLKTPGTIPPQFWLLDPPKIVIWHAKDWTVNEFRWGPSEKFIWVLADHTDLYRLSNTTGWDHIIQTYSHSHQATIYKWEKFAEQWDVLQIDNSRNLQGGETAEFPAGGGLHALSGPLTSNREFTATPSTKDHDIRGEQQHSALPTTFLDNSGLAGQSSRTASIPEGSVQGSNSDEVRKVQLLRSESGANKEDVSVPEHFIFPVGGGVHGNNPINSGESNSSVVEEHVLRSNPSRLPFRVQKNLPIGGGSENRQLRETIQPQPTPLKGSDTEESKSVSENPREDERVETPLSTGGIENISNKPTFPPLSGLSPYVTAAGHPARKPIITHWLRYLEIGGVEMYCYNMTQALPKYEHHVYVRTTQRNEEMFNLFNEAGIPIHLGSERGVLFTDNSIKEGTDILVDHTTKRFDDEPSSQTHPNIKWVKVYHAPRTWAEDVAYHAHVAVSKLTEWPPAGSRSIFVCHGCVDTYAYTGLHPSRLSGFVIGRYGSVRPQKFSDDLLEILKGVNDSTTDFSLVGDPTSVIARTISRDLPKVKWRTPSVDNKFNLLDNIDAAIYKNGRGVIEGFSLSIVEMMAAGIPIVAENRGGNREQIEHGITGLLINYSDTQGFIDALIWLKTNPKERIRMGQMARAKATMQYDLTNMRHEWEQVLT